MSTDTSTLNSPESWLNYTFLINSENNHNCYSDSEQCLLHLHSRRVIPGPCAEPAPLAVGQGTWKQAFQLSTQEAHLESTYGRKFTTFFVPYSQNAIFTQRQVFLANEERDPEFKKKKKKILTFTILTFHHLYQELEGQSLLPKYKINVMILVG